MIVRNYEHCEFADAKDTALNYVQYTPNAGAMCPIVWLAMSLTEFMNENGIMDVAGRSAVVVCK